MNRKLQKSNRRLLATLLASGLSLQLASSAVAQIAAPAQYAGNREVTSRETAAAPQQNESPLLYSPYAEFKLPFVMDQGANSPAQIQLVVSRDQGTSWQLYTAAKPDRSGFLFRSNGDGEYWFNLRIADAQGNVYPSDKAPMRVVVDTRQPTGQIRADLNPIGQIVAEFAIHDANPAMNTIRTEYRTDADPNWREVTAQIVPRSASELTGTAIWDPPSGARTIDLRVSCLDQAKNRLELTQQLTVPRIAQNSPAAQLASQQQQYPPGNMGWATPNNAGIQPTPGATAWNSDARAADFNNRPVNNGGLANPNGAGSGLSGTAYANNAPAMPPTAISPTNVSPRQAVNDWRGAADPDHGYRAPGGQPSQQWGSPPTTAVGSQLVSTPAARNDGGFELMAPNNNSGQNLSPATDSGQSLNLGMQASPDASSAGPGGYPLRPISVEELPAPGQRSPGSVEGQNAQPMPGSPIATAAPAQPNAGVTGEAANENASGVAAPGLAVAHEFSRSRALDLPYSISGSHGSRIAAVELWGTEDGGVTWDKWTTDQDPSNSFKVKVDHEGLHGFSIVVVGANGLASRTPRPGDAADQWIFVDTQAPKARIISAKAGEGSESGSLVIDYVCQDENLADRPLSLSFAENREGPWTTIATGLRNAGRYVWPADPSLPSRIYLRIEAVDQAGNVGVGNLDLPVDVQSLAPRGRIQGFRPIGG